MRKVLRVIGFVVGLYLVVRAVVEPFVIDMSDPATYRDDWGGPSLGGVLAIHCGPGAVAAVLMTLSVLRLVRARRSGQVASSPPTDGGRVATGGTAGQAG